MLELFQLVVSNTMLLWLASISNPIIGKGMLRVPLVRLFSYLLAVTLHM